MMQKELITPIKDINRLFNEQNSYTLEHLLRKIKVNEHDAIKALEYLVSEHYLLYSEEKYRFNRKNSIRELAKTL